MTDRGVPGGDGVRPREQSLNEVVVAASSLLDPTRLAAVAVSEVRRLLGVDGASLTFWDADLGVLVPLAFADDRVVHPYPVYYPGHGLIGEAFRRDGPVIANDYQADIEHPPAWSQVLCGAAVPLHAAGVLLGSISAQSYSPRVFTAADVEVLESVAAQVGPALGTMRTLARAQLRAAQAYALAHLMRRGAELSDQEQLFRLISDTAVRLLGADLAGLVLLDGGDGSSDSGWHGIVGARGDLWRRVEYGSMHPAASTIFGGELHIVNGADGGVIDPERFPFYASEGIRVGVALPLEDGNSTRGSLCLGWRFQVALADEQLQFGEALAAFAGTLVMMSAARAQRAALVSNAPVMLVALDADGYLSLSAGAAAERVGLGPDVVGRRIAEVLEDAPEVAEFALADAPVGEAVTGQIELRGRVFDASVLQHRGGRMLVATDVTERVAAEAELARRATEDELTGLPNEPEAVRRIAQALGQQPLAVAFVDIRNFDQVNEAIGYDAADDLLRALGLRLAAELHDAVVVGRVGGDEFVVAAHDDGDPARLGQHVRTSMEAFISQGPLIGIAVEIRCGIASMPAGGDAQLLLRYADSALQLARRGEGWLAIWNEQVATRRRGQAALAAELRLALAGKALDVAYQPILDLRTDTVTSVEALARWTRANGEPVSPALFVGLAESLGRIGQLTELVLDHALADVAAKLGIAVSVNVSALEITQNHLPALIADRLERYDLHPLSLTLELTESAALESTGTGWLDDLAALGVGVAVDDFGRGWSSMEILKRLPASRLKLDRSYVAQATDDAANEAIVRASVSLGHALGMEIVAEGVEDAEVMDAVTRLGCDHVQGYHVARPMGADALANWLRERDTPRSVPER